MKHKSVDYKLCVVNYYLNHEDGYDNTCKIFDCKKSSLKRWIQRYKTSKNLTRRNRKPVSYKITKPQVKTALELLKQNEQLTMNELEIEMSHNNELIKNAITKSGNHYLFCVPYTPKTDAIEQYFNQVKIYLKKDKNVANFQELEKNVEKAIDKVKPENYKNYFEYAYNLKEEYELKRKLSTLRRKLKIYK
jgi:hypothetical protein